jgi:oligo-1,6-glucosidase
MNREAPAARNVMSVGEAIGIGPEQAPLFVDADRVELNMIFHFDALRIDRQGWRKIDWRLSNFKAIFARLDAAAGTTDWNTTFLGNHDTPNAVSHFGDDSPQYRVKSAKALATMMLTQRGTPYIYQGDELGVTN